MKSEAEKVILKSIELPRNLTGALVAMMARHGMSQWSGNSKHKSQGFVTLRDTVYPTKYAHGFVVLCFVVVMQSFIMNSHEVFIHIHQGCFAGTGAIVRLPQCQWSKPDGYGKISQCITTTKHSKAKTVCIFLGIYCTYHETPYRMLKRPLYEYQLQWIKR